MRRVAAVLLCAVSLVAGCQRSSKPDLKATPPLPVKLSADLPDGARIGVVVSQFGEGADLSPFVNGTAVAQFRLNGLSATTRNLQLLVEADNGSSEGAVAAVRKLDAARVAGIVYASIGEHVGAGLSEAQRLGIAVVRPYAWDHGPSTPGSTTWATGPNESTVRTAISDYVSAQGWDPVVFVVGSHLTGALPAELLGSNAVELDENNIDAQIRAFFNPTAADTAVDGGSIDSIVVWGPPKTAARVVGAIQREVRDTVPPIILPPSSQSPTFARTLVGEVRGSLESTFLLVGSSTDSDDTPGVTAFLAAVRAAAADSNLKDAAQQVRVFGREGAVTADHASHDAVLLLAAAIDRANSTVKAKVLRALRELDVSKVQGLAGSSMLDMRNRAGALKARPAMLKADPVVSDARASVVEGEVTPPEQVVLSWFRAVPS